MDDATLFALLVDLHRDGARQGPGGKSETLQALELCRLDAAAALRVADIGCGTGASTQVLAQALPQSQITAIDLFADFLLVLEKQAAEAGYAHRVKTLQASMEALPIAAGSLDLIWSEGAIYNMGFEQGLRCWRPLLRERGLIAVSEITWLRPDPAMEIRDHWQAEYPQIATAAEKIATLEAVGFDLRGYFPLPPRCWIDNYYAPAASRLADFVARHGVDAEELAQWERQEAALYRRYQDDFSYGFYIAQKRSGGT